MHILKDEGRGLGTTNHLALLIDAHLAGGHIIKDFVDDLDLCIMVPAAQSPHLHSMPMAGVAWYRNERIGSR